jgi:hypothetical protein
LNMDVCQTRLLKLRLFFLTSKHNKVIWLGWEVQLE